ncbi:ATP-grasp fold amidoligase family protein [Solibacillus silvestris]|uniref:ATP-grasp fold amidoligase family protein n=1 Tax=Solibacillus silvestris TaxID=76853 RepID=UPI003F7E951F
MQVLFEARRHVFAKIIKLSPIIASKLLFFKIFKRRINLDNPQTYNEKLMWLKLFEDIEFKVKFTDKVEVRKHMASFGFGNLLIPVIGVFDRVEDIIFEQLPKKFVLKCSHGSGLNIICTNKRELDYKKTKHQLAKWMETDYSLINAEPHYSNIKPRIIIEHFLEQPNGKVPIDYHIHCFHGEPKIIELVLNRFTSEEQSIMLTPDWQDTHYIKKKFAYDETESKPKQIDELLAIAKRISKPFTYVQVDLTIVDEKVYFSKLDFTPAACLNEEINEEANSELGQPPLLG